MTEQLRQLGAPSEKIFTIPCGVDCDFFRGARPETSPPHFVMVARFVEKKGHRYVLEAFARLYRKHAEARLYLIGNGPLLPQMKCLALGLGISQGVVFHGARDREFIRTQLQGARALVQPSIEARDGDREGTPVSVLEAGACGLPVVVTPHGGLKDLIEEGVNGFFVPEKNVAGLAKKFELLYRDPLLAEKLGTQLQKKISLEYSLSMNMQKLRQVIESAMEKPV
jgi:glycosyltransferase involved in cell wall biosynthesis